MQHLEVSGATRPIYGSLGVKGLSSVLTQIWGYGRFTIFIFQENNFVCNYKMILHFSDEIVKLFWAYICVKTLLH
jgi:hypothetical protein